MKKRTILSILAFMPLFSFLDVNALTLPPEPEIGEPIHIESQEQNQPRSIEPECYYLEGYVYIICDNSVTSISATVTRLSDNAQWSDSSSSNTLQIAVPTDSGTYHLTLTLSDGSSYYGDYILL